LLNFRIAKLPATKRFTEKIVFLGLVTDCRLAKRPANRSPFLLTANTEGVVRIPSAFSNTRGWPPSITAIAELVVPKSIPNIFGIVLFLLF